CASRLARAQVCSPQIAVPSFVGSIAEHPPYECCFTCVPPAPEASCTAKEVSECIAGLPGLSRACSPDTKVAQGCCFDCLPSGCTSDQLKSCATKVNRI